MTGPRRRRDHPIGIPTPNALRIWGYALDGPGALEFSAVVSEHREDQLGLFPARAFDDDGIGRDTVWDPEMGRFRPVRSWLRLPWVVEAVVEGRLMVSERDGTGA